MIKEVRFTVPVFTTLLSLLFSCQTEKREKVKVSQEVEVQPVDALDNVEVASSVLTWKGSSSKGAHNGTIGS